MGGGYDDWREEYADFTDEIPEILESYDEDLDLYEEDDLEEFSLYGDDSIQRLLDDNLEEQTFHRQEIETAYRQGDEYAVTVLLSTFFESYLSHKLSDFADENKTVLDSCEIQDGALSLHKMIDKADKLDIVESNQEKTIMRGVASSRNQYIYDSFESLDPENPTIIQENDLLEPALDLYDSRLGIKPDERISTKDKSKIKSEPIERIENSIKEGSKATSTILLDSVFQQYMTQQLNKPGNGSKTVNGSKIKPRQTNFTEMNRWFKNLHYAESNQENFIPEGIESNRSKFDRMMQVFNAVHSAKTKYSHDIKAFAEGNGIQDSDHEKGIEYFEEIIKHVIPEQGTYFPTSEKDNKWK